MNQPHFNQWMIGITAGICLNAAAQESDLTELSMKELLEVEITLDSVFDIFGGLIETRQVSVATGKKIDTNHAPAVSSVITAQDIEAMGARTLNEALESVPGLHVSVQQFYQPIYIIRGIYSPYSPEVLLLINGQPFKGLESGDRGMAWHDMPVQNIARVEIMRGPGSAIYGADAFAGIINVITKTAQDNKGTEIGIRGGSFASTNVWALHGGQYAGWNTAASVEIYTTDGIDNIIASDAQSVLDKQMGTHASLAPGSLNLGERNLLAQLDVSKQAWQMRLGYSRHDDVGTGAGINQALDPVGHYERERLTTDLIYHNPIFTPMWDITAELNYVLNKSRLLDNRLLPPGTMGLYPNGMNGYVAMAEEHIHAGLSGFYAGITGHLLRLGGGVRYQDMYELENEQDFGFGPDGFIPPGSAKVVLTDTPYAIYGEQMRKNWYLFVQDSWRLSKDWDITLGLRYDDYSDFGHTLNPRVALVWQVAPRLSAKFLYGRAFREPAFRELYIRNNPVFQGNPNLQPESIQTWEWALDWRVEGNLNLVLTPFYSNINDKIQLTPSAPDAPLQTFINQGKLTSYGVEFEARWKMNKKSSILFNYSYAHSEINGKEQGMYPMQDAYLRVDWLVYPNWYLDTKINHIGHRQRFENDPRISLDGYTTVDVTLRYKDLQQSRWNFALGARNLFNANIREPATMLIAQDLPLGGRTWFAEARYHFD